MGVVTTGPGVPGREALAPGVSAAGPDPHGTSLALADENGRLERSNRTLRGRNQALIAACERFRALYELAPVPYVTVGVGRLVIDLNHAAEQLLARSRHDLLGMAFEALITPDGQARIVEFIAGVFVAGHARCGDVGLAVAVAAAQVEVLIDGLVLQADDRDEPSCVLALIDITARRQAEKARRQAQDEMLAIVSHDLRGPLGAIDLACGALAEVLVDADQLETVAVIARSSARCERLIKDLLGVAHLESGRLRLTARPMDLSDLVGQVARDLQPAVHAAGCSLTLVGLDRPHPLRADFDRLYQVVANLLGNALFHARGAAIEVVLGDVGEQLQLRVTDDGPGIPPDELAHVFERYRHGARHRGGAGLGLAIVKGLVVAHGGEVAVRSEPGAGATFVVRLPRTGPPAGGR